MILLVLEVGNSAPLRKLLAPLEIPTRFVDVLGDTATHARFKCFDFPAAILLDEENHEIVRFRIARTKLEDIQALIDEVLPRG